MIGVQRWDGIFEDLATGTVGPVVKDVSEEINGCIYDFGRIRSAGRFLEFCFIFRAGSDGEVDGNL